MRCKTHSQIFGVDRITRTVKSDSWKLAGICSKCEKKIAEQYCAKLKTTAKQ